MHSNTRLTFWIIALKSTPRGKVEKYLVFLEPYYDNSKPGKILIKMGETTKKTEQSKF